jgi:hypothetical protein
VSDRLEAVLLRVRDLLRNTGKGQLRHMLRLPVKQILHLVERQEGYDVRVEVGYVWLMMVQKLSGLSIVDVSGSRHARRAEASDHRGRGHDRDRIVQGTAKHGELAQWLFEELAEVILLDKTHIFLTGDLEVHCIVGSPLLFQLGFCVWLLSLPYFK